MDSLTIKSEYADNRVAFKGSGLRTLGEQSQESLIDLAIIALQSQNKNLINLFEDPLPTLTELQVFRVRTKLK